MLKMDNHFCDLLHAPNRPSLSLFEPQLIWGIPEASLEHIAPCATDQGGPLELEAVW